jgi:hypothetical protein
MNTSTVLALSTVLVLGGCGGGDGSSSSTNNSSVFVTLSPDDIQNNLDANIYHQQFAQNLKENSQLVLQSNGIVDLAVKLKNTQLNDTNFMSLTKSYDDAMINLVLQSNTLLINSINLNTLHSDTSYTQSGNITRNNRIVFTTAVGLGLLAYGAYNLFKKSANAITENGKNNIINLASSNNGRSAVVKMFQDRGINLSNDASLAQITDKIKTITINQLNSISRETLEYSQANFLEQSEVLESARTKMVETAVTMGEIAVEGTVTGATGVTGSVGNLLPNKYVGAAFDVVTTVTSTDPLSLVNKHVSASAISKNKIQTPIEPTNMQISEAKEIIEQISKEGASEISVGELEDSVNAIVNDIAKKDGDGDDNLLSVPEYATSQSYTIFEAEKENVTDSNKASGVLKIYDAYKFDTLDVMITNDEEIDHTMTDVVPYLDDNLLFELQPKAVEKSTLLSFVKVSETEDSITYTVTATITGVLNSVSITATPTNASLTTATQTLTADGSLSWNVIVLDKDAIITVSRSDSSSISTTVLKGKVTVPSYIEIYKGVLTSVHYSGDNVSGFCLEAVGDESSWLVDQNGYLYAGTVSEGKITGDALYLTTFGDVFDGTIYSGQWTDGNFCSGTYAGGYLTLSAIKEIRDECAMNGCEFLQEINDLITYKEAL